MLNLYTDLKNLQVSTFQGTEPVVVNAAAARSRGIENDVLWLLPVRGLSFFSSVGFADARYSSYPDGPVPGDYVQPRNAVGNQHCGPPDPNAASGSTKSCSERDLTGQRKGVREQVAHRLHAGKIAGPAVDGGPALDLIEHRLFLDEFDRGGFDGRQSGHRGVLALRAGFGNRRWSEHIPTSIPQAGMGLMTI